MIIDNEIPREYSKYILAIYVFLFGILFTHDHRYTEKPIAENTPILIKKPKKAKKQIRIWHGSELEIIEMD